MLTTISSLNEGILLNLSEDNESIAEVIQYKMRWEDDSE
jgi:hypothetical protein